MLIAKPAEETRSYEIGTRRVYLNSNRLRVEHALRSNVLGDLIRV